MSDTGATNLTPAIRRERVEPHLGCPGDLFAFLWREVEPHLATLHSVPWKGGRAAEFPALLRALRTARADEMPAVLVDYLCGGASPFVAEVPRTAFAQRAFVVMKALDRIARDVHPSHVAVARGARPIAPAPIASAMRQRRWVENDYGGGVDGTARVVPKGPILNRAAPEHETASGDRLETQFEALALLVAPPGHFEVRLEVLGPKDFPVGDKVVGGDLPSVGMAPVAEDGDDLAFSSTLRNEVPFLDARAADAALLARRSAAAVERLLASDADVLLLPELCMGREAVEEVVRSLAARAAAPIPRLVALGSGPSGTCPDSGRPYNECVIVDGQGRELWRQRKLNHFLMGVERMRECGLPLAREAPHVEDVATGTVLHVLDLPHFGRVVVLICEDLEQHRPCGLVVPALRPDWILTPVLDVGQAVGRWTHARAVELGRTSGSRVVVANSATLSVRRAGRAKLDEVPPEEVGIGLLVDPGRRVRVVTAADGGASPVAVKLDWEPALWHAWKIT